MKPRYCWTKVESSKGLMRLRKPHSSKRSKRVQVEPTNNPWGDREIAWNSMDCLSAWERLQAESQDHLDRDVCGDSEHGDIQHGSSIFVQQVSRDTDKNVTSPPLLRIPGGQYQNARYIVWDPPPWNVRLVAECPKIPSKCKLTCSRPPQKKVDCEGVIFCSLIKQQ